MLRKNQTEELLDCIEELKRGGQTVLIALDGRCAAGKTTLAAHLCGLTDGTVFHMDDYFLQPFQRTRERLDTPGGNVDYERFREEILLPLAQGAREICYRPYNCRTQKLEESISVEVKQVVIAEGSYSCHPALWDAYTLRVFLDVEPEEQMRRIVHREGEAAAQRFRDRWIPLEERYFAAYQIREECDFCIGPTDVKREEVPENMKI